MQTQWITSEPFQIGDRWQTEGTVQDEQGNVLRLVVSTPTTPLVNQLILKRFMKTQLDDRAVFEFTIVTASHEGNTSLNKITGASTETEFQLDRLTLHLSPITLIQPPPVLIQVAVHLIDDEFRLKKGESSNFTYYDPSNANLICTGKNGKVGITVGELDQNYMVQGPISKLVGPGQSTTFSQRSQFTGKWVATVIGKDAVENTCTLSGSIAFRQVA
jgi:hypothetical protein